MKPAFALAAVFAFVITCAARSARAEPVEVKRVLRAFNFEERQLGNREDLPMYWTKVQAAGYPHYVNGRLTTDQARDGKYSFRLDLNGGSVAYRYGADLIHVTPGAYYRVEGYVRTTVLPHARARLSAYFVDRDGRTLEKTIRHAEPYAAREAGQEWRQLRIELSADDPAAAFMVLEMGLLQPAQYADQTLGDRTLNVQDIRGSAWFDDITVSQVPRVAMSTDRPANVFRRGDPVRLSVRIDDRFTDDLGAQIVVADADGKVVYQRSGAPDLRRAEQVAPGCKRLTIELPEMPAGFYRVSLVMSSLGQSLGAQQLSLVQLADANPPGRPDKRFGFVATSLPFEAWDDLPKVLPMLSAGRVKLSVWGKQGDVLERDPGKFDTLLETFDALGITPTACLTDLPPVMLARLKKRTTGRASLVSGAGESETPDQAASDWSELLRADPQAWQPQLAFLISRHANHLDRWQIGADGSELFVTDPKMRRVYDQIYSQFGKLIASPDLAMPWPAWQELDSAAPATVALSVPAGVVLPNQVPIYLADVTAAGAVRAGGPAQVSVSLNWLDADRYARRDRLRDLAQRVIYTMSADARRIDFPLPLTVRREQGVLVQEPTEELLILRTLITALGGATYKGKLPIADGVEAFLFDRDGQGMLAMWDRGTPAGIRELALHLGKSPAMIDLWGNVTPLHKLAGKEGWVSVPVGRTPLLLVGIDGELAQTRASVALDRPLIESSFVPHTRHVRFTNRYRDAISGTLRLRAPAGWQVTPSTFNFNLNSGETFDKEVTIELPYNSVAGEKRIEAEFKLQANGGSTFAVPIALHLGLSDVGMQTMAMRDGGDLIVQQMVTNYGDKPIDFNAFAVFPGLSRQERLISGLAPGKTTVKRYRFTGGEFREGIKVRVGMKEMEGTRILNDEVMVQ